MIRRTLISLIIALLTQTALASTGISLQGRILKSDGSPVTGKSVQFRIQIRSPGTENCLLYEEAQTLDMSASNGMFALTIGQGARSASTVDGGYSLERVFSNTGVLDLSGTYPAACALGTNYIPSGADNRKVVYQFNDGTGWQTVPTMTINWVPLALNAMQVGGFQSDHLVRVMDASGNPATAPSLTSAQATELMNLIMGSSTQYITPNGGTFTTLPQYAGTPTNANDLVNKSYVDAAMGTALPDVGTAGTYYKVITDAKGRVISGAASLVEADIPNLTTAGKVDGGAINAGTIGGSASISTSGNIVTSGTVSANISSANQLRVYNGSNYVQFTAPTLSGNLPFVLPAADGTAGQVLKTDGAGNLSWITPSSGSVTNVTATAPLSSSGGSTPDISISQAGAGADGYLSSTDWNTFNSKLGTATSFSGDVSGAYNATSVDKIKGTSVSTSGLVSGQFLKYNGGAWINTGLSASDIPGLDASAITSGTLPVARGGTGVGSFSADQMVVANGTGSALMSFSCSSGQALAFSALGAAQCENVNGASELVRLDASGKIADSMLPASALTTATSFSGDVSGTYNATSVDKIKGVAVSGSPSLTTHVLQYNGSAWVPTVLDDTTKLPLAGGTLTGSLSLSPNTNVLMGTYASDPAGLGAADEGRVWYNTTSGALKYWDGSAAKALGVAGSGLQSLNGSTATTQTFATPGTSGTAPDWSTNTGTGVHTLNIPMASTASVTAGLISKTDYDAFNNKLGTSTSFSGDVSGAYNATSVDKIKGTGVSVSSLTSGDFLRYNGSAWVNSVLSSGDITTALGYTPVNRAGDTMSGALNLNGNNISNVSQLSLKDSGSNTVTLKAPSTVGSSFSLTLPVADGSAGQFLKTDGSGNLSWGTATAPGDATYSVKGIVQFDTDAATSGITVASGVASVNAGTGANQIVKLDASSKLPAVDGSALTNLNANNIASGTLPIARGGTGASTKTAAFDALSPLTTKGDVIVFDGTNNIRLPAGSNGQVLTADSAQASGVKWAAASTGTVTSVTGGTGLTGGTITSVGTLAVDVGTGANQIVQLDASSKLPAVDGSALTGLNADNVASGTLPVSRGGTGSGTALTNNKVMVSSGGAIVEGSGFASTNTASTFVTRDASGNFAAGTGTFDSLKMNGSVSGTLTFTVPSSFTSYSLNWPTADGSAGQFLKTDGSGNLSWASASSVAITSLNGSTVSTQTFATPGTSGTAPDWSTNTGTGVHTLNIPMASTASVTAGLISKTDYDAFNNKLGTGTSFSGDVSGAYNATSVDKIKGTSVSTSSLTSGDFLRYNGSAWVNSVLSSSDITTALGYTPVNRAGDTMSGALNLNGNNVSNVNQLSLKDSGTNTVTLKAPTTVGANYSLVLPTADGSAGQFLKTDGAGNLSWATSATPGDATYSAKGIVQFDTDAATSGITVASGVASVNAGTGANQIVKLDGTSKLPAVDGSALTNLNANNIASGTLPIARGGTGASTKTAAFDALSPLTTKGDVIVFDGTNNIRLPAGSNGQVLTADSAQASGVKWAAASTGTVTSVTGGTGLTGGTITSVGTLAVDVGTGANQIVQLDASSKLPAVDGSSLTNLSTTQITSGTLPVSRGGTGASSFAANNLVGTNGTGTALQAVTCAQNQIISFDASGNYGCYNLSSIAGGTYFAQNGNSFGAAAVLGTNDNNTLSFETNNSTRLTIDTSGNVGIGTSNPGAPLDVKGEVRMTGATSGYAGLKSPAVGPSVTWTLPTADGSAGQFLKTDGSGNLSWATSATPGDATYSAKGIVQFDTDAATSGITVASGVASVNAGTGANQIVKLDGTSKLPAVDGSALTNLNANNIASGTLPIARGGTGASTKTAAFDALSPNTTKGDVIVFDGTNNIRLPAGSNGQVLTADSAQASGVKWAAASSGTVTSITGGTGLTGGTITSVGTLAVDVGTGANQIVQLDGSSKLPSVDGSALTNLNANNIASGTLSVSRGGTGSGTALTNNKVMVSSGGAIVEGSGFASTNTASTFVTRDASGNFAAGTGIFDFLKMNGSVSGTLTFTVPSSFTNYSLNWPTADGSAGQFLKTDGAGNLSWASAAAGGITSLNGLSASSQTFAVGTSGTAPAFSSATSTHTLNIPMASTASVTAGLISKTDYDAFNNKLGTSTSFSGDVSGVYNATSVDKIKGTTLSISGLASGNFLKYNGSAWVNSSLASGDITTALGYTPVNRAGDTMSGALNMGGQSVADVGTLSLKGSTSGTVSMTVPATVTSYSLNWPSAVASSNGQVLASDTSGNLTWTTVASAANTFVNDGNSFGSAATLGTNDNNDLNFETNDSTRMVIDSSGNVGIGVTPTYGLHVKRDTMSFSNTSGGMYFYATQGNMIFGDNSTPSAKFQTASIGSKSTNTTGVLHQITNFSSTASITKTGVDIQSTGTWNGAGAVNIGLNVNATGGTTNYAALFQGGNVGIGTTTPGAALDVKGEVRMSGATSGYAGFKSPAVGPSVTWTLPTADGSAGQFLKTDGAGNLSWASAAAGGITSLNGLSASSQTFAIGTSGTAPAFSSATSTHTLNIPMASTASVTAGLISKTDYDTFNSKLGTSTSFSGDVSGAYNATSVDKIKGTPVSISSLTSGNYLKYNGSAWVNSALSVNASTDITSGTLPISRGGTGASSFAANNLIGTNGTGTALQAVTCTQNQVISFDASGNYGCYNLSSIAGSSFVAKSGDTMTGRLYVDANNTITDTWTSVEHTASANYSGAVNGFQSAGDTLGAFHAALYGATNNKNTYAIIGERRTNSNWTSSAGAIANGTYLPGIGFAGQTNTTTGTGMVLGASINAVVNGTVSSGTLPTDLVFHTTATNAAGLTERMRITSAGNVGIGTANPSHKLHVVGDGNSVFMEPATSTYSTAVYMMNAGNASEFGIEDSAGGALLLGSSPYASVFGTQSARSFQVGTNNTVRMTIDSSGNLGIGTASPGEKLTVVGGNILIDNTKNLMFKDSVGNARNILTYSSANNLQLMNGATTGNVQIGNTNASNSNGDILFYGANTERLRIESTGNVGIGTTTPTEKLEVSGNLKVSGTVTANQAFGTLTDGATIVWTVAGIINNATVTLGGNRTLSFSGLTNGMTGTLIVKQDATGGRTLTLPAQCANKVIGGGGGVITLSTAANAIDILTFTYDGTNCYWTYGKNYN